MILGRDLLMALRLYLEFSKQVIVGGDGPYESFTGAVVYMCTYYYLNKN